uniref:Uncharacterized protein n=1 Tax=Solanum lycopersicum TaxID=4081 RepID=K4C0M3_SOLLC
MQKALKALDVSIIPHNVSCLYLGTYTIWILEIIAKTSICSSSLSLWFPV